VLGLVDPLRTGLTPWFIRVRCTPDAAASIAEAVARRTDTRWVSMLSGGTEIFCLSHSAGGEQDDALLLQKLPQTPRVVQVTAHALLHVFFGQDLSPVTRTGPLTAGQIAALVPRGRAAAGRRGVPSGRDLGAGRAGAGRPPSAGRPRSGRAYVRGGPGRGHRLVPDDGTPAAVGAAGVGGALLRPRLQPGHARPRDAGGTVAGGGTRPGGGGRPGAGVARGGGLRRGHHGHGQCLRLGQCRDPGALYQYLTGPVAALPGIRRTETAPYHRTLKGPSPYYDPARLPRSPERRG
jgi:hypothetical protein